jgi:Phosphodiester glycosidase
VPEALKDAAFTLMGWLLTPLGVGLVWAARAVWQRAAAWRWRRLGRALAGLMLGLAVPMLGLGGVGLWVRYRPHPAAIERTLHPGIVYRRFARSEPRPLVVHVATVALDTPGLRLVPTPAAPGGCLPARTTSSFLAQARVQLAVNAQFFYPCPGSSATAELEPEALEPGQPLRPVGVYAVAGQVVVERAWHDSTVYIDADGAVTLYEPPARLYHAISGRYRLVQDGRATAADDGLLAPRVALGLDAARRRMTVVVIDGRQRGYSEGVTLPELGAVLVELGVHDAIELDGGGSATLVAEGEDGEPVVLSSPIHGRIPGRERPVANHLGVAVSAAGP